MGYFNFKNNETALNDTNLNAMQKGLMELVFPIGSTYITQVDTNPNEILKFGTWERLKGKVCLGLDEDDNDLKTIGKTGGEKKVTLASNQVPDHTHEYARTALWAGETLSGKVLGESLNNANSDLVRANTYGVSGQTGQPHNNMQPYEVVGYMWIRRA